MRKPGADSTVSISGSSKSPLNSKTSANLKNENRLAGQLTAKNGGSAAFVVDGRPPAPPRRTSSGPANWELPRLSGLVAFPAGYGDKSQSTLWEENKPAANRLHPTMKPVELIERALLNSSKAGDLVADFFGGSGSTLIACERLNRKTRLMELDPRYGDVICRRYQEYVGKPAVLDGSGLSFDKVARERRTEAA